MLVSAHFLWHGGTMLLPIPCSSLFKVRQTIWHVSTCYAPFNPRTSRHGHLSCIDVHSTWLVWYSTNNGMYLFPVKKVHRSLTEEWIRSDRKAFIHTPFASYHLEQYGCGHVLCWHSGRSRSVGNFPKESAARSFLAVILIEFLEHMLYQQWTVNKISVSFERMWPIRMFTLLSSDLWLLAIRMILVSATMSF